MRAVLCRAWGPPESLTVEEIAAPDPGPGEVAVNVKATALNFFDTLIIAGKYQFKPAFPFSPGAEVAGIVKAAGKGVVGFDAGDRVVAWTGWGGCREEMVVGADQLVPLPDAIDFATASALTVTYGTTLHALRDRAKLKPGETLAVLGAAGGTGQAAVELGKIMGARVIACASSDDKLAFCRSLGADEGVNYASEDLKDRLRALTGGAGVDVVYDPVGGSLAEAALRSTAWEGRFLVVGFAAGEIPKIPTNLLLVKGSAMLGVFWGEDVKRNPERHRTNMASLLNWCLEGRIRPHIHRTYRLEETAAALQSLARREVKGKVVVVP